MLLRKVRPAPSSSKFDKTFPETSISSPKWKNKKVSALITVYGFRVYFENRETFLYSTAHVLGTIHFLQENSLRTYSSVNFLGTNFLGTNGIIEKSLL